MSGVVQRYGKWRIKPAGKLPIFLRFMINSSFTHEISNKCGFKYHIPNRAFINHMMYWPANEYDAFEAEILGHLKRNDGWIEKYCSRELKKSEALYQKGMVLKKIDWSKKTNEEIEKILFELLDKYRYLGNTWYAQYTIDLYFEEAIEEQLVKYLPVNHPDFRHYVLTFTDPKEMTDVSKERHNLIRLAKKLKIKKENLKKLSRSAELDIAKHLANFAYINRGLATSHPYTREEIISRINEAWHAKESLDEMYYYSSEKKIKDDLTAALKKIKPKSDFNKLINQAREHSYVRNRRVEAFFFADYGASFMYQEIARRSNFNPNWIMEISIPEMFSALHNKPLPNNTEMMRRLKNYAMEVKQGVTTLITDPKKIKILEKKYRIKTEKVDIIQGRVACLGGIIRGRAKVCNDKSEIGKVNRGDILVAPFTTPDFIQAMEKAAAIVADQGGLSSHAAIVSRELGVPCVIATEKGTRVIKDNDLLEVDAKKGIIKIIKKND